VVPFLRHSSRLRLLFLLLRRCRRWRSGRPEVEEAGGGGGGHAEEAGGG
jgi:hypothetical protein